MKKLRPLPAAHVLFAAFLLGATAVEVNGESTSQPTNVVDQLTGEAAQSKAAFRERLASLQNATEVVALVFDAGRREALDDLLGDTFGVSPAPATGGNGRPADFDLRAFLTEHTGRLAAPLSSAGLSAEQIDGMAEEYRRTLVESSERMSSLGQVLAATRPEAAALSLKASVALPLVHVADRDFRVEDVGLVPAWARTPQMLPTLEQLMYEVERPQTALCVAAAAEGDAAAPEGEIAVRLLRTKADQLLQAQSNDAAVACLALAVDLAEQATDDDGALRQHQAQVLADLDRPAEAAALLLPQLAADASAGPRGRAAMLRLKFLYGAGELERVIEESDRYLEDPGARPQQPQILYIRWVAARQLNLQVIAGAAHDRFLRAYDSHPLAADLYFADAMEALARSDYDEAGRLLEFIVFRFQESRLVARAESILQRLEERTP